VDAPFTIDLDEDKDVSAREQILRNIKKIKKAS